MPHYLPSGSDNHSSQPHVVVVGAPESIDPMADLKMFWGAEICRLEYLVHLLETGRIKNESRNAYVGQAAELASFTS